MPYIIIHIIIKSYILYITNNIYIIQCISVEYIHIHIYIHITYLNIYYILMYHILSTYFFFFAFSLVNSAYHSSWKRQLVFYFGHLTYYASLEFCIICKFGEHHSNAIYDDIELGRNKNSMSLEIYLQSIPYTLT